MYILPIEYIVTYLNESLVGVTEVENNLDLLILNLASGAYHLGLKRDGFQTLANESFHFVASERRSDFVVC